MENVQKKLIYFQHFMLPPILFFTFISIFDFCYHMNIFEKVDFHKKFECNREVTYRNNVFCLSPRVLPMVTF